MPWKPPLASISRKTFHTSSSSETDKKNETKKVWRSRVSIPVPPACKAGALPFELHPQRSAETEGTTSKVLSYRAKRDLRQPGVEPGAKAWEASMLPIHHWRSLEEGDKSRRGGAGFRSLCLPIANRPLYQVSYTPVTDCRAQKVKYKLWGSTPCLLRDWRLKPAP